MKKLYTILTLLVLSAAMSFSQVKDNSEAPASVKSGTGSIEATILKPLTISDAGTVFLGEFVKSTTPYTPDDALFEGTTLDFYVTGEPNHEFFYQIVPDLDGDTDGDVATIELSTLAPDAGGSGGGFSSGSDPLTTTTEFTTFLDENGQYTITIQVSSVTAIESGTDDFVQKVYVSYTSF